MPFWKAENYKSGKGKGKGNYKAIHFASERFAKKITIGVALNLLMQIISR